MNYTYKQIWLINLPVMMSILMEQLINITDAIFLGHVGEVELGASAIDGIYYLALYMLGFGFSIGLQVIIARRNGEKNYQAIGKTFFQGLFFLSGLAAFLCLLIHLVTPFILQRLITSPEIYQAIIRYLDWRSFGLLFSFPFLAMRSFFVGITDTTALSWAALIAVLINIPFNYFLIFTLNLGITGAAIASSLAEMGSFLMLLTYLWKSIDKVKYGLKPIKYGLKPIYSGKILKLGYAIGFPIVGIALLCIQRIITLYTDNEQLSELAIIPFIVMLLNYTFALPGYIYLNAVGGTGRTKTTFVIQATTTVIYLIYLYELSYHIKPTLAIYLTAEYLFVILLATQSIVYLKRKHY